MKNLFESLFFLVVLTLAACSNEKVDEVQLLKDEVIAIHDEVMPYMGELKSLKKELEHKSDSLAQQDSLNYQNKINELNELAKKLDDAFEGMFVWMRQFKAPDADTDSEIAVAYFLEQKTLVEKVNADIKLALKDAKKELDKN